MSLNTFKIPTHPKSLPQQLPGLDCESQHRHSRGSVIATSWQVSMEGQGLGH